MRWKSQEWTKGKVSNFFIDILKQVTLRNGRKMSHEYERWKVWVSRRIGRLKKHKKAIPAIECMSMSLIPEALNTEPAFL